MLRIVVLGSAAGGGFPQWNCAAEGSRLARAGKALARTQSSIAVCCDDRHWFLFNASPDLRHQINATPQLHPAHGHSKDGPKENLRHSPIAGAVLTNADVDHIAGLLTLRESTPLAIYATGRVLGTLAANSIFNVLNPEFVDRREITLGQSFFPATAGGAKVSMEVEAFAVPGKVALYLEDAGAGANFGTQEQDTVGVRITCTKTGAFFFYIPGCARMPADLARRLGGAPLVLFDGTLWQDDEMIDARVGVKSGQRMGHMSMWGEDGTIAAFRDMKVERKVFIHINNTNPTLLDDTAERKMVEDAGWEISFDGMEINL